MKPWSVTEKGHNVFPIEVVENLDPLKIDQMIFAILVFIFYIHVSGEVLLCRDKFQVCEIHQG